MSHPHGSGGRVLSTVPRYLFIAMLLLMATSLHASEPETWSLNINGETRCNNFNFLTQDQLAACQSEIDYFESTDVNDFTDDFLTGTVDITTCAVDRIRHSNGFIEQTTRSVRYCGLLCPDPNNTSIPVYRLPSQSCPPSTDCPPGTEPNYDNNAQCEVPLDNGCTAGEQAEVIGPAGLGTYPATTQTCNQQGCTSDLVENFRGGNSFSRYTATTTGASCADSEDTYNEATPATPDPPMPDDDFPDNGCVQNSDGSIHCSTDQTTSPPVPDNGTPGTPATPDSQQTDPATGDTYNYYNNTTTNNSTNTQGTPGPTGNTGVSDGDSSGLLPGVDTDGDGQGDCDPSVEDCGGSQTSGGINCDDPPICGGDAIQCAIRFQAWSTRCNLESSIEDLTEMEVLGQVGLDGLGTLEEYFDTANNPDSEINIESELVLDAPVAGTCPPDLTANAGKYGTFTIPSSVLCDVADYIRPVLIAFAYLVSGLMIHAAIVREI